LCVKVPYDVEKIHTVKLLKNFNVMPRKFHEIYHHYVKTYSTLLRTVHHHSYALSSIHAVLICIICC